MKLSAFRIRLLPIGGYLDFLFFISVVKSCFGQLLLCLSLSSCGCTISPNFFSLQDKDEFAFFLHLSSVSSVHTMKQDENCSNSVCVSRNTMQDAVTND